MIFVDGLSIPEGPVVLPDGSWVVVEMGPDRGCITHITDGGRKRRVVAKTGRPNGLAVDRNGMIWAAESDSPALLRMDLAGHVERVVDKSAGGPFLFPNDLCFGPDGMLYLTDSGIRFGDYAPGGKIRPDYLDVHYHGRVYRIDPQSFAIDIIADDIKFTNGLAFGPGDTELYVAETITGDILRYPWSPEGLGKPEIFANVIVEDGSPVVKGPDGIAFGANGDLYVTVYGQSEVVVLDPRGAVKTRIKTLGFAPTNVAFGLNGEKRIYVTEDEFGRLETFDVDTGGLPLHDGAVAGASVHA